MRSSAALFSLIYTTAEARRRLKEIRTTPITEVTPGLTVYVDLRYFGGATWYASLSLPDADRATYLVECHYTRLAGKNHRSIYMRCDLFDEEHRLDHYEVRAYGWGRELSPDVIAVTAQLAVAHHLMLPDSTPSGTQTPACLSRVLRRRRVEGRVRCPYGTISSLLNHGRQAQHYVRTVCTTGDQWNSASKFSVSGIQAYTPNGVSLGC